MQEELRRRQKPDGCLAGCGELAMAWATWLWTSMLGLLRHRLKTWLTARLPGAPPQPPCWMSGVLGGAGWKLSGSAPGL